MKEGKPRDLGQRGDKGGMAWIITGSSSGPASVKDTGCLFK